MPPGAVAGGIGIVIDVLRASTTIVTALAHGAAAVRPVSTVEEARSLAGAPGDADAPLLGGERGGLRIGGFDLGNSPGEYTRARVSGRRIVITTTNGTAAVAACVDAAEVLIGAIVNRSAVAARARSIAKHHGLRDVHLVCAGTDGHVTEDDLLAAGAILDAADADDTLDRSAATCRDAFRAVVRATAHDVIPKIAAAFAASRGGRNLLALGMQDDLFAAAAIDVTTVVPRLDRHTGCLVADAGESPAPRRA